MLEITSSIDSLVHNEINIDKIEPFDLFETHGLHHIKLFRRDEFSAQFLMIPAYGLF